MQKDSARPAEDAAAPPAEVGSEELKNVLGDALAAPPSPEELRLADQLARSLVQRRRAEPEG